MILIADSGSTKTSWCLTNNRDVIMDFETEGFNPYFTDSTYISESLRKALPASIEPSAINKIHFYGSGCFPDKTHVISSALSSLFPKAAIGVELDLLGTARALLGNKKGFAAILGTGTNSCLYDGNVITMNIDSLGYILGDEGSGTFIGKRLLADYLHGYMPADVHDAFSTKFGTDKGIVFDRIYSKPLANRYCASFVPFLKEPGLNENYVNEVLNFSFEQFFEKLVTHYPSYDHHSFNCSGSIAYHFSDSLLAVANRYNMQAGMILKQPMDGLIHYHQQH